MPQTWDEKGNVITQAPPQAMPIALPGSAAANPNAPAVMPPSTKPKQSWDEHGKSIQAAAPQTVEKTMPFSSGVVSGMMLDPSKIAQQKTTGGQVKEVGKEMLSGTGDWLKKVAMDPLHIGDPIDALVKGQEDAYKDVHEGLRSGNHDQLMHGLGLAVGNLSTILGGAKSVKEGFGVASTARDASFAAKDLTAKRAIVSAASHGALDTLRDEHSVAIDTAVRAERQRIGGAVQSLNTRDLAADPKGYVPQKLALATLDQAVSDKKANVLLNKRMLPKVSQVRGLLEGHTGNMTFNDLKQVRTVVGGMLKKSEGVERAVLSDYYSSLSQNLKSRAAHLGGIAEWQDYNEASDKLAKHEDGLIPELKESKTGLEYAKKIVSEQNQGRLNTLTKDLHMPSDTFSKAAKTHKAIINFAKMSEGDSITAKTANRLIALKQHPISATLGGTTGVLAGRALGTAMGSPMAGSFIGLTLGAAFAHDLMSKYDAAQAIREIGGPSGVMGVRPSATPPTSTSGPSGGPGGGGPSSPQPSAMPSGPSSPSASLSPSLAKLLSESGVKISTDSLGVKWAEDSKGVKVSIPKSVPEGEVTKYASSKIAEQAKMQSEIKAKVPEAKPLPSKEALEDAFRKKGMRGVEAHELAVETLDNVTGRNTVPEAVRQHSMERIERIMGPEQRSVPRTESAEPKVTKVAEGERGREASKRTGMTKDTPEARRAKARERIAAKREEGTRTQIKGSLEDQARQVAGRMNFQGRSNLELEEGLQELYGENGKRFLKQFQSLAKQQKWSDEVYRGYLEDTLDRRAKELAQRPNIPGLHTEPKVE